MKKLVDAIARIRAHDTTLLSDDVAIQARIGNRLGWTTLPEEAPSLYPMLDDLTAMAAERAITDVILIGMGGSSLTTYVFEKAFAAQAKRGMYVLDTTCPDEISDLVERLDFNRTLLIISSKSGTTLETVALEHLFWDLMAEVIEDTATRASHIIAITDADTPLAQRAEQRGYTLITAPADVGGRYSAFSVFGLAPAALVGMDVRRIVDEAISAQRACEEPSPDNPAVLLASELLGQYKAGHDKLVLPNTRFSLWIEQLLAESLGKDGKGIITSVGASACCCTPHLIACPDNSRSPKRSMLAKVGGLQYCVKQIGSRQPEPIDIPTAMVIWMWTTALLGVAMGLNPFDEPDIARAKESVLDALEADDIARMDTEEYRLSPSLESLLDDADAGDYLSVLAYVDKQEYVQLKNVLLPVLARRSGLACSISKGPRYLHSIRQLHQGGPRTGRYLVIDDNAAGQTDIDIARAGYSLRTLFNAQRIGDVRALRAIGRPVVMTHIADALSETFC